VLDQTAMNLERAKQTVDFPGDVEGFVVVDEALELISEGRVELDSNAGYVTIDIVQMQYGD
jgi:hypothetical protein